MPITHDNDSAPGALQARIRRNNVLPARQGTASGESPEAFDFIRSL